jgi:hypothetical protein
LGLKTFAVYVPVAPTSEYLIYTLFHEKDSQVTPATSCELNVVDAVKANLGAYEPDSKRAAIPRFAEDDEVVLFDTIHRARFVFLGFIHTSMVKLCKLRKSDVAVVPGK